MKNKLLKNIIVLFILLLVANIGLGEQFFYLGAQFNAKEKNKLQIESVYYDTPAYKYGLQKGDIIEYCDFFNNNGEGSRAYFDNYDSFRHFFKVLRLGYTIKLSFLRNFSHMTTKNIKIEEGQKKLPFYIDKQVGGQIKVVIGGKLYRYGEKFLLWSWSSKQNKWVSEIPTLNNCSVYKLDKYDKEEFKDKLSINSICGETIEYSPVSHTIVAVKAYCENFKEKSSAALVTEKLIKTISDKLNLLPKVERINDELGNRYVFQFPTQSNDEPVIIQPIWDKESNSGSVEITCTSKKMQELLIKEQTQLGGLVLNQNNLGELDDLIKTGPDDRDDLFHKPRIKSEKFGKLFNKIPIDWDEKDFDKVEKFIKQYGKNANYFPKFKNYIKINQIIEPTEFNGRWNCDGIFLTLNLTGGWDAMGNDPANEKKCIAMSGYKDVYDLESIKWNEKEGKATIEFKFAKGFTGLLSKNNIWNLSLKNEIWNRGIDKRRQTLVVKTEKETLYFKYVSGYFGTKYTTNRIIPKFVENTKEKEFLKSVIVDSQCEKMRGITFKEAFIAIANNNRYDSWEIIKTGENEYTLSVKFQDGFKSVKVIFTFYKDANLFKCNVKITGETSKAVDDFINFFWIGLQKE